MFKNITVNLTERICDCEDTPTCFMHVKAGVFSAMSIRCKTCRTELLIPHSKLRPTFTYLEDLPPPPLADVINIVKDIEPGDDE